MSLDFDHVYEGTTGRTYRYVDRLEDDEKACALTIVSRSVAASRVELGLVPQVASSSRDQAPRLWCGCEASELRTDERGVAYCGRCT